MLLHLKTKVPEVQGRENTTRDSKLLKPRKMLGEKFFAQPSTNHAQCAVCSFLDRYQLQRNVDLLDNRLCCSTPA